MSWLKNRDDKMAAIISKVGPLKRRVNPDLFASLVFSIVGQQLSMKAHRSIWKRVIEKCGPITPSSINDVPIENLQICGLSLKKARYLKGVAEAIISGELDLDKLRTMNDEDVIKELTVFKGIGIWTAEMLLIFSLERPNVFSFKDVSIIRGLKMLYHHIEVSENRFEKYRKKFSPYCTIASFYLWEIASGNVDLTDL